MKTKKTLGLLSLSLLCSSIAYAAPANSHFMKLVQPGAYSCPTPEQAQAAIVNPGSCADLFCVWKTNPVSVGNINFKGLSTPVFSPFADGKKDQLEVNKLVKSVIVEKWGAHAMGCVYSTNYKAEAVAYYSYGVDFGGACHTTGALGKVKC